MARKKQHQVTQGWALYLRTSDGEAQAPERSQEGQRRAIHERLLSKSDLPIIAEYADTQTGRADDRASYLQLLEDARQGKFSYVAVFKVDRFGRNNTEIGRAVDELIQLGITIRLSDFPDLDVTKAGGRLVLNLLAAYAHFESDTNGERTVEAMETKLLQGGWTFRVPGGYVNKEKRTSRKDAKNARYRRWVEQDPEQAKMWRLAWDMLLVDQKKLKEICIELHNRGYRLRSGRSFVGVNKAGRTVYATNALSRAFHNWFYAGWIVIDNDLGKIPPKTVRGDWEPIVSTEEFERGLEILKQRNHKPERKKKYFYLLRGLIYLENEFDKLEKLVCSRPNANRTRGGVSYYSVPSSKHNFLCHKVDAQIERHLDGLQINPALIPELRKAYEEDLQRHVNKPKDERAALEQGLKAVIDEETRALGLYAAGKISEEAWDIKSREWQDRRRAIEAALEQVTSTYQEQLADLDAALRLITKVGILYKRLDQHTQREMLMHVIERVVINLEGNIVKVDLKSPFAYLRDKAQGSGGLLSQGEKEKTSSTLATRSFDAPLGVPNQDSFDQPFSSETPEILFFDKIAYPHRSRIERFLSANAS